MTDAPTTQRRVRRLAYTPATADVMSTDSTVATRKLASYEANAAATDDDETETNQYGEAFNDMDTLDDDEDEPTAGAEWASFDPELESRVAENYGVGEGWVEDDAFHTYFRESDRVIDGSATDDDDENDSKAAKDDDDTVMQADDSYEDNE